MTTQTSYICVKWLRSFPDEPVEFWSEFDSDRVGLRKVRFGPTGHVGHAGPGEEVGGTRLDLRPAPSVEDIGSDPQFQPEQVSQDDFERGCRYQGPLTTLPCPSPLARDAP